MRTALMLWTLLACLVVGERAAMAECTLREVLRFANPNLSMIVKGEVQHAGPMSGRTSPLGELELLSHQLREVSEPLRQDLRSHTARVYTMRFPEGQLVVAELTAALPSSLEDQLTALPNMRVLTPSPACHVVLYSASRPLVEASARGPAAPPRWLDGGQAMSSAPYWASLQVDGNPATQRRLTSFVPGIPQIDTNVFSGAHLEASFDGDATAHARVRCEPRGCALVRSILSAQQRRLFPNTTPSITMSNGAVDLTLGATAVDDVVRVVRSFR